MIHLVRDLLDTQVLDRRKRPVGKVDGIALELRPNEPPRLAYLEVDAACAWRRLGERFGRWAAAAAKRWRGEAEPYRFRWAQVRDLDIDIEIDADVEETSAFAAERWLRKKVSVIPGGRGEDK